MSDTVYERKLFFSVPIGNSVRKSFFFLLLEWFGLSQASRAPCRSSSGYVSFAFKIILTLFLGMVVFS